MSIADDAVRYAQAHRDEALNELLDLLTIPSVSTLSEHQPDMRRAAEWLAAKLTSIGMNHVAVLPTAGHPVVYADWLDAPGKPVVLVYGHYDVQPVDPLGEWLSPPFEPTVRDGNLYARGASDMKGQDVAVVRAIEAFMRSGGLPVNVKVLFEGEEEIGSPNLGEFIDRERERLMADVVLNCDSSILRPDLPSLVYGLRGLAYFEIWVHGPSHDLHSGSFGGSVHNPAQALCELIAGLHDADGRVNLPGFYDRVRPLSPEERDALARVPRTQAEWLKITGAPRLHGEAGYTLVERLGARPTLEVNGLLSGFTGEGAKTVLPGKAMAKVSMRLVPDQDPEEVRQQLAAYLEQHAPPTVRWELTQLNGNPASIVERDSPGMRAAVDALEETFGVPPVFVREGGSVPIVGMIQKTLGADSILMGFGLPDDNLHAPNERFHLPNFYRGIDSYIRFFAHLGRFEG